MPKALVLEENELFRCLVIRLLARQNIEVKAFPDPDSYLKKHHQTCSQCQCQYYDLVIIEKNFRNSKGLDFLMERKKQGCPLTMSRIAVISSDWTKEDLERAVTLGCHTIEKSMAMGAIKSWLCKLQF